MTIGYKIKQRRIELGYSQKELADKVGLTYTSISNIERGQPFNVQSLNKICEVLNLRIELIAVDKERTCVVIDAEELDYDVMNCCKQLDAVKRTLQKLNK